MKFDNLYDITVTISWEQANQSASEWIKIQRPAKEQRSQRRKEWKEERMNKFFFILNKKWIEEQENDGKKEDKTK